MKLSAHFVYRRFSGDESFLADPEAFNEEEIKAEEANKTVGITSKGSRL
jgi:hypothetical protein